MNTSRSTSAPLAWKRQRKVAEFTWLSLGIRLLRPHPIYCGDQIQVQIRLECQELMHGHRDKGGKAAKYVRHCAGGMGICAGSVARYWISMHLLGKRLSLPPETTSLNEGEGVGTPSLTSGWLTLGATMSGRQGSPVVRQRSMFSCTGACGGLRSFLSGVISPGRLAARTPPSQGGNGGSIPLRGAWVFMRQCT